MAGLVPGEHRGVVGRSRGGGGQGGGGVEDVDVVEPLAAGVGAEATEEERGWVPTALQVCE